MDHSINNIYEVSIHYSHAVSRKRRKRDKDAYIKNILVRAPDDETSYSRASRIFLKLHPSASIVDIDAMVIAYPENNNVTSLSEEILRGLKAELSLMLGQSAKMGKIALDGTRKYLLRSIF